MIGLSESERFRLFFIPTLLQLSVQQMVDYCFLRKLGQYDHTQAQKFVRNLGAVVRSTDEEKDLYVDVIVALGAGSSVWQTHSGNCSLNPKKVTSDYLEGVFERYESVEALPWVQDKDCLWWLVIRDGNLLYYVQVTDVSSLGKFNLRIQSKDWSKG